MIRDHVWRPTHGTGRYAHKRPECAYMNCRRPRAEHERSVKALRMRAEAGR